MVRVEIYSKKGCVRCKRAMDLINKVMAEVPFSCKEVDIASSEELFRRFKGDTPTIFINGRKAFKFNLDEVEFKKKIRKEYIKIRLIAKPWNKKEHYT